MSEIEDEEEQRKRLKGKVKSFLDDFKGKCMLQNIIYKLRDKNNIQLLNDLEIRATDRDDIVKALTPEDFSEGPLDDYDCEGGELWVFGKRVKNSELYIKITVRKMRERNLAYCVSFHLAEHPMKYPFKNE